MAIYARIDQSIVAELFETDGDIKEMFHPSLLWVPAPAEVGVGWTYDGSIFSEPKPPVLTPQELGQIIAARRYQAESAGIEVGGMPVPTDRDSQNLINGAALSAFMDDTYTCNWKMADGFVKLDAKTVLAVAKAVRNHVQAAFDREATLVAAVNAGKYTEDMLDEGWPA